MNKTLAKSSGEACLQEMEARLAAVLLALKETPFWKVVEDPDSPSEATFGIMREIFAEVYSYQKRVDEAVFTAVGRFGRYVSEQSLVRSMIAVQIEEVGHGFLALHDYLALGGTEEVLEGRVVSPQAFALISVVTRLGREEHPLCHLGVMYFFERFTSLVCEQVVPLLAKKSYPDERLKFMRLHAEEDIRHGDMLANVILECVDRYPDARQAIEYGFSCFEYVYPLPLWNAAYERSLRMQ